MPVANKRTSTTRFTASGVPIPPMKLPPGARLVTPDMPMRLPPGAVLVSPGTQGVPQTLSSEVLPPEYTADSRGVKRASNGAPIPPKGWAERMLGKQPVSDTIGNAWEHAKNIVPTIAHQVLDPATPEETRDLSPSTAAMPLAVPAYRLTAKPSVEALREMTRQLKAGNYGAGFHHSDYDEQGNYHPSAVSSFMDMIPLVGPFARTIENEAVQKGALPALAGASVDAVAPKLAEGVVRGAVKGVGSTARRVLAPPSVVDANIPGDTVSYRDRWIAARKQKVNLDLAQATNSRAAAIPKRLTENSILGRPKFDANNAANIEALQAHAQAMQDAIAPEMKPEDFGNKVRKVLQKHRQMIDDQADHEGYANGILEDLSSTPMSREDFGNMAKDTLLQHQQMLNDKAGKLFDSLSRKVGNKQPDPAGIRSVAQKIVGQHREFYNKHPELLKGSTGQAWSIVNDLAGGKDIGQPTTVTSPIVDQNGRQITSQVEPKIPKPDTWSDLHHLRSALLDQTRSPLLVEDIPKGWLKQLTGAVDSAMTGASSGLRPGERATFRDANDIYRQMKETYDDPQSKLYHVVRAGDGYKAAEALKEVTPEVSRQIGQVSTELATPELTNQLRRQTVSRLFDPTNSGELELDRFAKRWKTAQKEKLGGVLPAEHMNALNDLAKRLGEAGPYDNRSTKTGQIVDEPDGTKIADTLADPTPETVRDIATAAKAIGDEDLIPQLQRHVISQIINRPDNELPGLQTLHSRFLRVDKNRLGGVLTPDQIEDLSSLARTSGAVTFDSNKSGTAKVMQPGQEAADLLNAFKKIAAGAAVGAGAGEVGHAPILGAAAGAATTAVGTFGRGKVAGVLTDPNIVDSVMSTSRDSGVLPLTSKQSAAATGVITQSNAGKSDKSEDDLGNDADVSTGTDAGSDGNWGTPPPDTPGMTPLPAARQEEQGTTSTAAPRSSLTGPAPPAGATHEVLSPDGSTVTGHVVDGAYVPLTPIDA